MNLFRLMRERKDLVSNPVARELKGKYKGSALGILWSLLTPLFMAAIYVFFLRLLARNVPLAEIIIGVFAWQFTVLCVQDGTHAVTGNANLVKKVFFPRVLLPVASTLSNLVNYLLSLVVQFPLIVVLLSTAGEGGGTIRPWVMAVPVVILYQTFFNAGLAFMLSSLNVYFRDTQHLVGVAMSAWFFLSPVMYNLGLVQSLTASRPWIADLYMLNPLAGIIEAYRALILSSVTFPFTPYAVAGLAWPVVFVLVAHAGFLKAQKNFADLL